MERKKGPICSPGLMHCAYLHARPAFWIQALCGVFNGFRRRVRRYGWFYRTKLLCCVFKCQDTSESVVQERQRERERERERLACCCVMCSGVRRRMEVRGDRGGPDGHLQTSTCVWTQSRSRQRAGRNQPAWGEEGPPVYCVAAWWNQMTLHNKHHQ